MKWYTVECQLSESSLIFRQRFCSVSFGSTGTSGFHYVQSCDQNPSNRR